jgi:hypothetical protein
MSSKSLANPPESGERRALGASEAGRLLAGLHDTPDQVVAPYVQAIQALSAEAKSREEELARVKRAGLDPTRAITALDRHYRLIPPYLWQFDPNFRSLQARYVRSRVLAIEKTGPLHVGAEFILAVRAFGQQQKPGESRADAHARILGWLEKRLARTAK